MSLCAIAGAFLLAFWLTFYAKDILLLVTDIIFAPLFKLKVKMVSLFGLTFFMEEEKWKISFLKPEPLIQHDVRLDTRKNIESSDGNRCLRLHLVDLAVIIIRRLPVLHRIPRSTGRAATRRYHRLRQRGTCRHLLWKRFCPSRAI